jgi:uncharacterized protein
MPEYLAPGVFVEEVSYRAKSIEGVSTTTTGFVGPTRYGPTDLDPEIITSLVEFERIYGGRGKLTLGTTEVDNYMWNAVRAFFEEGGKRLYASRVYKPSATEGRARRDAFTDILIRARFPGAAGNGRVTLQFALGHNRLVAEGAVRTLKGIGHGDIVHVSATLDGEPTGFYLVEWDGAASNWRFSQVVNPAVPGSANTNFALLAAKIPANAEIRRATVSVFYEAASADLPTFAMVDLALDSRHSSGGSPDSLLSAFAAELPNLGAARSIPVTIEHIAGSISGLDLLYKFVRVEPTSTSTQISRDFLIAASDSPDYLSKTSLTFALDRGNDGVEPDSSIYEGSVDLTTNRASGLKSFENVEDISIVAAPGSSYNATHAQAVANLLISHAQNMRYRIAVIDSIKNHSIADVRAYRAKFDSKYAAFYYPWVRIIDPVTNQENHYPPSGFVAGIYARNDVERAVYKAPANEVVNLSIGFEKLINKGQQEVLNPEGINCFRYFEGRGMRLWGARTMTSDPEWKYVNLRRYFAYLERSIDKGTQWAVFEPNGEKLWANVRRTISDFLLNEWQNGALLGEKPETAYFVKCDRGTMTQNDLDNGRLVCQIGVAPLRPAEFVIFRIGQWTSDRKA